MLIINFYVNIHKNINNLDIIENHKFANNLL